MNKDDEGVLGIEGGPKILLPEKLNDAKELLPEELELLDNEDKELLLAKLDDAKELLPEELLLEESR